jgi:dihydrofolate synthase/folylpolyglutamate synthase
VLLETGMGGRYDATNVVEQPICTVLASISMDHMQFLGNRIEDILVEKMGIMRENVPCVAYDMEENLKILWLDNCNRLNCPWVMTDNSQAEILSQTEDSSIYSYKGNTYELHTTGTYQIYNSLVAIEVINMVNTYAGDSFKLNETHITSGLAMTNWTGRFQKIKEAPLTYVDGAHNEGGWLSLKENIETYFAGRDITFICGVLADKEYDKMVDILSPFSDNVITVTPDNPRALSGEALAKAFEPYVKNVYVAEDIFDAERISESIKCPVVVVCGSLSFIGPLIEKYSKNTM